MRRISGFFVGRSTWTERDATSRPADEPIIDEYTRFDEHAELLYDLALRALTRQESAGDEVRARAATLLATATFVMTFLGGLALDREGTPLGGAAVVAAVLFAWTVFVCLDLVRPRSRWKFIPDAWRVNETWMIRRPLPSASQVRYGLLDEMREARDANIAKLNFMYDSVILAVILIGLTGVAWLVELVK